MRVLVDTSVWVDFFNGHPSVQAETLARLIEEPDTYLEAAALYRLLRARGITIRSTIDCLIATLAAHHDALILWKDRDFTLIVESKLPDLRAMPVE